MSDDQLRWYRIDEQLFALAAVQHAAHCLEEVKRDWQQLPWAIIALHNATQASLIAHLTGTAGLGALEAKCAELTLAALQGEGEYPQEFVAKFLELVRRATKLEKQIEAAGGVLQLSSAERKALRRLNSLRNEFVHFSPKGWSVEISGLPQIALSCVTVFRGVVSTGWALRSLDDDEVAQYVVGVDEIEHHAQSLFVRVDV